MLTAQNKNGDKLSEILFLEKYIDEKRGMVVGTAITRMLQEIQLKYNTLDVIERIEFKFPEELNKVDVSA